MIVIIDLIITKFRVVYNLFSLVLVQHFYLQEETSDVEDDKGLSQSNALQKKQKLAKLKMKDVVTR